MVGEPRFFCFWMPLIGWRLGKNRTVRQKYTFTQKSGVSVIVYGRKVKGCRILLVFAEKGISLAKNAVEIREI